MVEQVAIPSDQVFPIDPSIALASAAEDYQQKVMDVLPDGVVFDCILLGMGPDGHTASLFPDHPLVDITDKIVAPISDSPKPPPERVTLTLPVLNAAKNIVFVVTGESKADKVSEFISTKGETFLVDPIESIPASLVQPTDGTLTWILDPFSSSKISPKSAINSGNKLSGEENCCGMSRGGCEIL